jgi:hypothetical protein
MIIDKYTNRKYTNIDTNIIRMYKINIYANAMYISIINIEKIYNKKIL